MTEADFLVPNRFLNETTISTGQDGYGGFFLEIVFDYIFGQYRGRLSPPIPTHFLDGPELLYSYRWVLAPDI